MEDGKIYENAFEWRFEFPEVLDEDGNFVGFDVVIGNPPYIDSELMTKSMPKEREYLTQKFETAKGNWDLFIPFLELTQNISKNRKVVSMIIPNKWLGAPYAESSRFLLRQELRTLIDYTDIKVFNEAGISPIVIVLSKGNGCIIRKYYDNNEYHENTLGNIANVDNLSKITSKHFSILQKIDTCNSKIKDAYIVFASATTSDAYRLKEYLLDNKFLQNQNLKLITTGAIQKYYTNWGVEMTSYLKSKYLKPVIDIDVYRNEFNNKANLMLNQKIIITGIRYLRACYDDDNSMLASKSTNVVIEKETRYKLKFLLSLLNSNLMQFFILESNKSSSMGGGINISPNMIKELPIHLVNLEQQKPFISLVDKILEAKKANPQADTKELEKQIDEMVYELYGLSEEEIEVIEGESK